MGNSTQRPSTTRRGGDQLTRRRGDRLIKLPEIMEIWPVPEPTIRWLRGRGELKFIFKSGGRLMCWESDLYAHIEAEAAKDAQAQAGNDDQPVAQTG